MKAVIHQPEFIPPVRFFKRLMLADRYVILAHAQLAHDGPMTGFNYGSKRWEMRVGSKRSIVDAVYTNAKEDWEKIVTGVAHPVLKEMTPLVSDGVLSTNVALLRMLCSKFGVKAPFFIDEPLPFRGVDRIIHLCRMHKVDTVIVEEGQYVDAAQLKAARITVEKYVPEDRDMEHVFDIL